MENCGQGARSALRICGDLLKLLAHMQQHRGMASAWLAGDQGFQSPLLAKQHEIEPLFSVVAAVAASESVQARPCFTERQVASLSADWRSLIAKLDRLSPDQSLAQHTLMISLVLDWLAAFGDARVEFAAGQTLPAGMVRRFSHHLPALTEVLGQMRAVGVGIAAHGGCTPVAKVRLMFLTARAETLLQQALAVDDAGQPGAQARPAVHALVQVVRGELLAGSGITIRADQYFALATKAIDAVFAWITECEETLRRFLAAPQIRQGLGETADLTTTPLRERQA